ncbi:MAG TPA: YggT family protein [Acidimicrobiales bacterium]|nr:YggT family protein [Acidimicrobiales bacterium]
MILRIIVDILQAYLVILFVRIIFSWFPIDPWSKWSRVVAVLAKLTDPVLVPVRRVLRPVRIGGMGIDLSPLVVLILLEVLLSILQTR